MQRVEIISARQPRRRWSEEEKRRLVAEAFAPGAVISHVARQRGVATSCLFAWRRRLGDSAGDSAPRLIPVMIDGAPLPVARCLDAAAMGPASNSAVITWPDGLRLEVPLGCPAPALKALIAALRSVR